MVVGLPRAGHRVMQEGDRGESQAVPRLVPCDLSLLAPYCFSVHCFRFLNPGAELSSVPHTYCAPPLVLSLQFWRHFQTSAHRVSCEVSGQGSMGPQQDHPPGGLLGCRWSGRGSEALAGLSPEAEAAAGWGVCKPGLCRPQGRVFPHEAAVEIRESGAGAQELAAARLPQPHRWVGLIGAPPPRVGMGGERAGQGEEESQARVQTPALPPTHRGILASGLTPGPQFPHLWVARDRRLQGAQHLSPVFRCFRDWPSLYLSHHAPRTPSPQREM